MPKSRSIQYSYSKKRKKATAAVISTIDETSHSALSSARPLKRRVLSPLTSMEECPHNQETPIEDPNCPSWGLPITVVDMLKSRGITRIHDWQRECLMSTGVLDGSSLVYSAPTSGGKTYVSEIMIMRRAYIDKKIVIFVLPYVSIVMEKVKSLIEICSLMDVKVEGYYQSFGLIPIPPRDASSHGLVCVCVIEKANMLINSLAHEGRIGEIGLVVFDELHMIGDASRGYLLEVIGTKIKYMSNKINHPIQMIGMSATLPNMEQIAEWFGGVSFVRDFRPVKLTQYVFNGPYLYTQLLSESSKSERRKNAEIIGEASFDDEMFKTFAPCGINLPASSVEGAFQLVRQLMPVHCSLVFCHSRAISSKLACHFAKCLEERPPTNSFKLEFVKWFNTSPNDEEHSIKRPTSDTMTDDIFNLKIEQLKEERLALIKRMKSSSPTRSIEKKLESCLLQGVAWHNSNQSASEREHIEFAFRSKIISVICCTSTLAAGVNMPARRVMLMSNKMGNIPLSVREYRQMVGRAGRAGIDSIGESILFIGVPPGNNHIRESCKSEKSAADAIKLSTSPTEIVKSCIGNADNIQSDKSDFMRMRSMRCSLNHKIPSIVTFNHCVPRIIGNARVLNIQDPEKPIFSIFCTSLYPTNRGIDGSGKVVCSKLLPTGTGIDRLILDLIGGRFANTRCELLSFMKCTLMSSMMLAACNNVRNVEVSLKSMIGRSITFLQSMGFVAVDEEEEKGDESSHQDESTRILELTLFGDATHHTPFSIESAIFVREEFEKALPVINSRDELFACWLVAPVFSSITPYKFDKWIEILKVVAVTTATEVEAESNSRHHKHINLSYEQSYFATMVGATPAVLIGYLETPWRISNSNLWLPTQRFFVAMILCDVINEMPLRDVSFKYDISLGELESLVIQSASHSGQLLGFCKRMKWNRAVAVDSTTNGNSAALPLNTPIAILLKSICSRLSHGGVKHELLSLMRIDGLGVGRARSLFEAGFKNLNSLSSADSAVLAPIISRNHSKNELVIKLSILIVSESRRLTEEQSSSSFSSNVAAPEEGLDIYNNGDGTIQHASSSSFTSLPVNSELSEIEFALTELDDEVARI